MTFRYDICFVG